MINQHDSKKPHQVVDREYESLDRLRRCLVIEHFPRVPQKHHSKHYRTYKVQRPTHLYQVREDTYNNQQNGIQKNLNASERNAMRDRKHGDVDLGIIVAPVNGESPEMWGSPDKDDEK